MKKGTKWLLCAFSVLVAAPPAFAQVPAPCSMVGYTTKTFESDFTKRTIFDEAETYSPGYSWYRWNWFNVRPNTSLSGLRLDGSIAASGGLDGSLVSAARSSRSPGFVGTAFGGGACVEITLRFDPSPRSSSEPHPSFWAMSKEHLDGSGDDQWPGKEPGFVHFVEWDILEYFKVKPPAFLSGWIDWFGRYIPHGELRLGEQVCHRPFCKSAKSFEPYRSAFPPTLDWSSWQTVIGVWASSSAGQPGCIQTFLNGDPIASKHCWSGTASTRSQMEDFFDFSLIDRHHMVLVIGSGKGPIFVRSVRVYQADSHNNLSN